MLCEAQPPKRKNTQQFSTRKMDISCNSHLFSNFLINQQNAEVVVSFENEQISTFEGCNIAKKKKSKRRNVISHLQVRISLQRETSIANEIVQDV